MIRYGILMDRKMNSAESISLLKRTNAVLIAVLSLKVCTRTLQFYPTGEKTRMD
jgi:hypothetical protein